MQAFGNSISKKLFIIGFLTLLFLIPTGLIIALIMDRTSYRDIALEDISSKWGKKQNIGNIILYIPYVNQNAKKNNESGINTGIEYLRILPEQLDITAQIDPEIRKRGIFNFIFYNGGFKISGKFKSIDYNKYKINPADLKPDQAFVQMEITDLIGLKDSIRFNWNRLPVNFDSGLITYSEMKSGVNSRVPFNNSDTPFEINIDLRGCEELKFYPNGRISTSKLYTSWQEISYSGAFLPGKKEIGKDRSYSEWKVLDLNRKYPQVFSNPMDSQIMTDALYGLKFMQTDNVYKESTRAVKYEIMFVLLTFIMIFMMEILYKKRLHPFQYILIGFALVIFYLLLLSLSEQIGFNFAYLISAVSIITMISVYCKKALQSGKFAVISSIMLTILYGFLFILLKNQDYSLLLGSIGILLILGLIMFFTRNIDWYNEVNSD